MRTRRSSTWPRTRSKVEHFTITLDDGNGSTIDRTIDVTITGTNDVPVVAAVLANSDSAGAARTESDAPLAATGTLTVSDVDVHDAVSVAVSGVIVAQGSAHGLTDLQLLSYFLDYAGGCGR